jgi:5'-methylthioadenosine phosphorylase
VDNYANGLGSEVVSYEHILSMSREHRTRTEEIVTTIIRHMG